LGDDGAENNHLSHGTFWVLKKVEAIIWPVPVICYPRKSNLKAILSAINGVMLVTVENRVLGANPVPVPLCPQHTPQRLA